jgi:sugar-specific transcriptional regulator TrmB
MDWVELFEEAGLTDREARSLVLLSSSKELKASDLAKNLVQTDLMHTIHCQG